VLPSTPLLGFLRFLGLPADNASHVAHLQQHYRLAAPALGTASNPIEPGLQAELDAYFAPFQAQLRKVLAAHRQCSRQLQLKRIAKRHVDSALARAG